MGRELETQKQEDEANGATSVDKEQTSKADVVAAKEEGKSSADVEQEHDTVATPLDSPAQKASATSSSSPTSSDEETHARQPDAVRNPMDEEQQ